MLGKYSRITIIRHPQDQTGADYQLFWIIRQSLYWLKFLQELFCYCSCACAAQLIRKVFHLVISLGSCFFKSLQQVLRKCTLVSHFHFIIKRLCFLNYCMPSHVFSFAMHFCMLLIQHLVQLRLFRLRQCVLPEKALYTLSCYHKQF